MSEYIVQWVKILSNEKNEPGVISKWKYSCIMSQIIIIVLAEFQLIPELFWSQFNSFRTFCTDMILPLKFYNVRWKDIVFEYALLMEFKGLW